VSAVSVSPLLAPSPYARLDSPSQWPSEVPASPVKSSPPTSTPGASPRAPKQPPVPNIPSNQVYIATSSIDGHVCVASLVDPKDVLLRNFARPVQSVALSPEYRSDRSYLSGGLAGQLILTVGGRSGVSANANTNSAAAAASGWLGSIGLGSNTGKDTVLHSGEGAISTIQWSLSGKFIVWANEQGIKIMRTNLHLESGDSEFAWKRIAHIDRPNRRAWEEMAGVWRARAQWVDDQNLESDTDRAASSNGIDTVMDSKENGKSLLGIGKTPKSKKKRKAEKLVVGWGDTAWVLRVNPGGAGVGKDVGERSAGSVDIVNM
jgi:vacuolar protein sorting-associated protein 41